jgi:hypothetical protein
VSSADARDIEDAFIERAARATCGMKLEPPRRGVKSESEWFRLFSALEILKLENIHAAPASQTGVLQFFGFAANSVSAACSRSLVLDSEVEGARESGPRSLLLRIVSHTSFRNPKS